MKQKLSASTIRNLESPITQKGEDGKEEWFERDN